MDEEFVGEVRELVQHINSFTKDNKVYVDINGLLIFYNEYVESIKHLVESGAFELSDDRIQGQLLVLHGYMTVHQALIHKHLDELQLIDMKKIDGEIERLLDDET